MLPKGKYFIFLLYFGFVATGLGQTIANFVSNGSFESLHNCNGPVYRLEKALSWASIDSISAGGIYTSKCNSLIPQNINTYQFPRTGDANILSTFYNKSFYTIGYLRNRLKTELSYDKVYCVKFYVNIANTSPRGIDGFGAYFADSSLDTITKCDRPLTFLTPQVSNPKGNVITDTLNWVPITGTFVAKGNEKYMVIGNFYADNVVATASINTPWYPEEWTDVCVDDVSCIEVDIAAYAGQDTAIVPGDSVFIGREPDFAVDPYCTWYKLPNMTTAFDTVSGLWVKPSITTTYVVRQELECGNVKWDTVVIHLNPVGFDEKLKALNDQLRIYPVPAGEQLELAVSNYDLLKGFNALEICNATGELVLQQRPEPDNSTITIDVSSLPVGIYFLHLRNGTQGTLRKRFVVER